MLEKLIDDRNQSKVVAPMMIKTVSNDEDSVLITETEFNEKKDPELIPMIFLEPN